MLTTTMTGVSVAGCLGYDVLDALMCLSVDSILLNPAHHNLNNQQLKPPNHPVQTYSMPSTFRL
jgi:hypothetical protein